MSLTDNKSPSVDTTEPEESVEPVDFENDGQFYTKAQNYWSNVDATINGMLGGFQKISGKELTSSRNFLEALYRCKPCPERKVALDCGAGIGRVTKGLLLPFFDSVDMVEQDPAFCKAAPAHIGDTDRLGEIHNTGLQDFQFPAEKYDVIWSQWVLGHLKDNDFVDFFRRAQIGLKRTGVIVIKENFTNTGEIEIDEEDSSVTRPLKYTKELLVRAGLRIVMEKRETVMPQGLYPVYMLAMKPAVKKE